MLKLVVMSSLIILSSLATQAADLHVCFSHEGDAKGMLTIEKEIMTLSYFVQFNRQGAYSSSIGNYDAGSGGGQVFIDSAKEIDSSKILIGSAFLIGLRDDQRSDSDAKPYPEVIVTVNKASVNFDMPAYKYFPRLSIRYPVVSCK